MSEPEDYDADMRDYNRRIICRYCNGTGNAADGTSGYFPCYDCQDKQNQKDDE